MKELCERDESTSHVTLGTEGSRETVSRFREKFLKEARNIARLNHPNIVRIIDVFEENGTAYYVMEYAENGSLADKVKRDGYLSEPVATRYILQVASALEYIHKQKMMHLDIKPANIMLNEKDEAVLIDFGLSKQYDATTGNQTSTTPVGISEGYAPMEQYMQGGVGAFSPQTDIYSLGATFYKLLTGVTPPNASHVNNEGLPTDELTTKGVSQNAIDVICKAMEGRKKDRMKDVATFCKSLSSSMSETSVDADEEEATILTEEMQRAEDERKRKEAEARAKAEAERKAQQEAERRRMEEEETQQNSEKSNSKKTWMGIAAGIVAIVAVFFGLNNLNSGGDSKSPTTSQSSSDASYSNGILTVNGVTYDMIKVQGGTFTMGATSEMKDPWDDEKPTHQVTLTNNYNIGKTEVTMALWKAVMGNTPQNYGPNKPVVNVSWNACQKFCQKLNEMTGQNFRLPTEAEWEFAARGGNNSNHYQYSGSNKLGDVAWYDSNSGGTTHDVATKQPNELGIYDMSGNVYEWCADWFGSYSSTSQTNPTGPNSGSYRVRRGGSWNCDAWGCRSSIRYQYDPILRDYDIGFRLALSELRMSDGVDTQKKASCKQIVILNAMEHPKPMARVP